MNAGRLLGTVLLVLVSSAALAQDAQPPAEPAQQVHGWPRVYEGDSVKITMYQPHVESWEHMVLTARAAVSVEEPGATEPVFGVVWFRSQTHIDKEQRLVTCEETELPRASFPAAPEKQEAWLAVLRPNFEGQVKVLHLDRLEAALAVTRAEKLTGRASIKNDPPRIIFTGRPSVLVMVDGAPVLRRTSRGRLLRVINTRAALFQDEASSRYYLAVAGDRWLVANSLEGPWGVTATVPEGAIEERTALASANQADLFDQDSEIKDLVASGQAPQVFASTEPAELIETHGDSDFSPVTGTKLLWLKNASGDVFVDTMTNAYYVLCSGRWFRAPSREGPWTFVPGNELPPDFGRIPPNEPEGEVLSCVPGTSAAEEAAIENDIPQTAVVTRAQAKLEVVYDGDPELEDIDGTTIRYVRNCNTPVVFCENRYYACEGGVWFWCGGLRGPWVCADSVPAVVYTIPPSCPIHYVTYCRVYRCTPESVWCGYTQGYLGTCISREGCVVWGTGYRHRPWVGATWIGRPCTYGFSVSLHCCSTGFGIGIGFGARHVSRPWWGPLSVPHPAVEAAWHEGHRDIHVNNASVYHRWGGAISTPVYHAPERRVEHRVDRPNNVYATPEGKVYRRTNEGTWEHRDQGTWRKPVEPVHEEQRAIQHQQQFRLEAEHRAREAGAARVEHHEQPRPVARPEPRPAPRPVPSGVRGGSVRHQGHH